MNVLKSIKVEEKTNKIFFILIKSFIIPVGLIIILGVTSYITASNTVIEKYKSSVNSANKSLSMYFGLLTNNIESKVGEIAIGNEVNDYYNNYNSPESLEKYLQSKKRLQLLVNSEKYLNNYYVISKNGDYSSYYSKIKKEADLYNEFLKSYSGKYFEKNNNKLAGWFGKHEYIDNIAKGDKEYSLTYYRKMLANDAFIIVDVDKEELVEGLKNIGLSENSVISLVTMDDYEVTLINNDDKEDVRIDNSNKIYKEDFYKKAKKSNEDGSCFVSFNNNEYLFVYSNVGDTNIMLTTLVPKESILSQVYEIRNITIIVVLLACLIALINGAHLSKSISNELKGINVSLEKVAEGNLSVEFVTNRNDEFKMLNKGLTFMVSSLRRLIKDISIFVKKVDIASNNIFNISENLMEFIDNVNMSSAEIESGVNMQLEYADLSLIKLGDLSDRIKEIKDCTLEFEENVREIVNNNNLEKKLFEEGRKNNGEFDVVINDLEIHYNQIINISFKMDEAFNKLNNTLKENDEGFQDIIMDMKQLFIDNNCNLSEVIKEVERCKSIIDFNINIADKVKSYKNIININIDNMNKMLRRVDYLVNEVNDYNDEISDALTKTLAKIDEIAISSQEVMLAMENQTSHIKDLYEDSEDMNKYSRKLKESVERFKM